MWGKAPRQKEQKQWKEYITGEYRRATAPSQHPAPFLRAEAAWPASLWSTTALPMGMAFPCRRAPPVLVLQCCLEFLEFQHMPLSLLLLLLLTDPRWKRNTHCYPPAAHRIPAGGPALALGSSASLLQASSVWVVPYPPAQEVLHTHCSHTGRHCLSTCPLERGLIQCQTLWAVEGQREPVCRAGTAPNTDLTACTAATVSSSHLHPGRGRGAKGRSTAARNVKTKQGWRIGYFPPHRGPGKRGWSCGLDHTGGGRKQGSEQVSHSMEKTPQKNHISGEFCRQVFGKVGELGTQRTYPSGCQIDVSHGCPITALSTCFTTLALLLAQRPPLHRMAG